MIIFRCKILLFFFLFNTAVLFAASYEQYLEDLQLGTPEVRSKAIGILSDTKDSKYIDLISVYLKDPVPEVKISAIKGILKLNAKNQIPVLIDLLKDSSPEVCQEVRNALIKFDDKEVLRDTLKNSKESNIRQQIVILFGESGNKEFIPDLIASFKDNDQIRNSIIEAFSKISDETVIPLLINGLSDPVSDIRFICAKTLAQLKIFDSLPKLMTLLDDIDTVVRDKIIPVLDTLIYRETILYYTEGLVKQRSINRKKYCIHALGILKDSSVTPLLFIFLKDRDATVREEAIKSLDLLLDKSNLFNLCLLLDEKDVKIRKYIVESLYKIKDSRVIPSLIRRFEVETDQEIIELIRNTVLQVSDPLVFGYYKNCLVTNKNRNVLMLIIEYINISKVRELMPALLELLKIEKDIELKLMIMSALRNMPDQSLLPLLHSALESEKDIGIKSGIVGVLKAVGSISSIPVLLKSLKFGEDTLNIEIEELLDQLASEKSISYFCEAINSKDLRIRTYCIKVIKKYPVSSTIPSILQAAQDKDAGIRKEAVEILGIIGDKTTIPVLAKLIKDKNEEVRLSAVQSLFHMGDPAVLKYALELLKDKSSNVKMQSMKILEQFGDKSIIPQVLKSIKSEQDPGVREEGILLLQMFGENDFSVFRLLLQFLKDEESSIRRTAASALGELKNPDAIIPLKDVYRKDFANDVRIAAMKSLAKLGAKDMIPEFIVNLYGQSTELVKNTRESLNFLIDEQVYQYLIANLNNEHKEIRDYCVSVLINIKSKKLIDELFNQIKNTKGETRTQIMKLITDITNDDSYMQDYISSVNNPATDNDVELQVWVLKNIARLKAKKSAEYLKIILKHGNEIIREEGVNTVKAVGFDNDIQKILEYMLEKDSSLPVKRAVKNALNK